MARRFGRQGASCHSNNLTRTPRPAGVRLVNALAELGFRHDFDLARARGRRGRWLLEVYPHPALIRLFDLPRILAYKKGPVADRRRGLRRLQQLLTSLATDDRGLIGSELLGALCARDVGELAGRALKEHEDSLDATLCAYLAYHCWRFGAERNEMIGDLATGYIVVPGATPA
jgi:predicted RNase H-like nuclease